MSDNEELFTVRKVAERWHTHEETIRRWLREGKLESLIIGRRRLVALSFIQRFESDATIRKF
jgi:excisionase family DNA binding protein